MNYYQLFDLPEKPRIDNTRVVKKYFDLQKKHHPDFFTGENEAAREDALEASAHVNKAYKVFMDPYKTLEYFLLQHKMIEPEEKYDLPPDFLMQMMDLNELADEGDVATVQNEVSATESSLNEEIEPVLTRIETGNPQEEDLALLKEYYYKKKYLHRILDRLQD